MTPCTAAPPGPVTLIARAFPFLSAKAERTSPLDYSCGGTHPKECNQNFGKSVLGCIKSICIAKHHFAAFSEIWLSHPSHPIFSFFVSFSTGFLRFSSSVVRNHFPGGCRQRVCHRSNSPRDPCNQFTAASIGRSRLHRACQTF